MKHRITAAAITLVLSGTPVFAQTIYPIDRAEILAGTTFDFKVEFEGRVEPADIKVTVNGAEPAATFGKPATYIAREDDQDQSALLLRDVSLANPGAYRIDVSDGTHHRSISWNVYDTGPRKAKNVILFIGDGLSPAVRTSARLLSKRVAEGKSFGKLAIDDMPHMALVATAGTDSMITDSANSASAYATGHKTANSAMGVYADRTASPFDDPRVETITSVIRRQRDMAIGIVTNAEVEDATPAAMVAHTRRRGAYDAIVAQLFAARPDVLMGGGAANFLPQKAPDSRRKDDVDYIARFREAGYPFASTAGEMNALAARPDTRKLLGLFAPGNMDGVLDRKFVKGGGVGKNPDQPDLTEQLQAALNILSRHDNGFFLLVESGLIDKYSHAVEMERAVYDTIMLDNAVRQARDWATARGEDTLILVVADHSHSSSLVGTVRSEIGTTPTPPLRDRVDIYDKAGFPDYPAPDADGYPARVDVAHRLAIFQAVPPARYEPPGAPVAATTEPPAAAKPGSLSALMTSSVHAGEDVILTATGPGSDRVRGSMDNTEVFRVIADALGLAEAK